MPKYHSPLTGCKPSAHAQFLASLPSDLPDAFFSSPAQKPASVLDGSGSGLVGIFDFCDTLPSTMSGDAWELAARHVLAMRQKAPEPCLFPQPEFIPVFALAMTGYRQWPVGIRDDFVTERTFFCSLDAPADLPQGSHDSMRFGNQINAFATVRREVYA